MLCISLLYDEDRIIISLLRKSFVFRVEMSTMYIFSGHEYFCSPFQAHRSCETVILVIANNKQ